jgi:cyclophilin family peptidyl-prolyl cis-trans isomerase
MKDINIYTNISFLSNWIFIVALGFTVISCHTTFKAKWTKETAPEYFRVKFETTKGNFIIEAKRAWSPEAVDRLYQLIKRGYYTDVSIYRVIPDYVAQFGIHNDSLVTHAWNSINVKDEPVIETNKKGTVAFARAGPETRTTNIFINLKDNSPRLDTISFLGVIGFPVIAEVVSGMDIVESFYKGYGRELETKQDSIYLQGNAYLKKNYPKLDYIHKGYIISEK